MLMSILLQKNIKYFIQEFSTGSHAIFTTNLYKNFNKILNTNFIKTY